MGCKNCSQRCGSGLEIMTRSNLYKRVRQASSVGDQEWNNDYDTEHSFWLSRLWARDTEELGAIEVDVFTLFLSSVYCIAAVISTTLQNNNYDRFEIHLTPHQTPVYNSLPKVSPTKHSAVNKTIHERRWVCLGLVTFTRCRLSRVVILQWF